MRLGENQNAVFQNLSASNHTVGVRERDDFYATDPKAIDALLESGIELNRRLLEPACGMGHLAKRLTEHGYDVTAFDIIDRGYGEVMDFFKYNDIWEGDIITNPPFKMSEPFIDHALGILNEGSKALFFLKLQFLEGSQRGFLFDSGQLANVYVFRKRVGCAMNGDFVKYKGSPVCYAWYEFIKGHKGSPVIHWINR